MNPRSTAGAKVGLEAANAVQPAGPIKPAGPVQAIDAVYAGEPGAFAEDAALLALGDVARRAVPGFRDVFEAVASGEAERGVLPIENLVSGTIRETYDLLLEHDLVIVDEVVVPVRLCLAALPGERLETIERVYSHIQALGQAEAFLRSRPWTTLTTYNTAGAGKLISERGERHAAAILSPRAAGLFGLEILAEGIESDPDNRTRFLVVARLDAVAQAAMAAPTEARPRRTTLVFAVRNEPGTLLRALRAFADRGLNLSKLESRPAKAKSWEYVFWVDLDADVADPACVAALEELRAASTMIRVLGSYPRAASA